MLFHGILKTIMGEITMSTFREYSSDSVYFIAGGETLEIIKTI